MLFVLSYLCFGFYLSFLFLVSIPIIFHCFYFVLKIKFYIKITRLSLPDERTLIAETKPFWSHSMSSPLAPGNSIFSFILFVICIKWNISKRKWGSTCQGDEEWRIVHWGKQLAPGRKGKMISLRMILRAKPTCLMLVQRTSLAPLSEKMNFKAFSKPILVGWPVPKTR